MHAASVCPEPESNSPTKEETDPFGTVVIASSSNGLYRRVRACVRSCHFSTVKDRAQTSQTEHWPPASADDHHTDASRRASTAPAPSSATMCPAFRDMHASAWARAGRAARLERAPALEGTAHGDLVGVLEIPAHREAAREARDAHRVVAERLRDVHRGRFAFEIRVRGEDQLADAARLDARDELRDLQIVRPDPVHGRDRAVKHVVHTLVLAGPLDREHIERLLDDAHALGVAIV